MANILVVEDEQLIALDIQRCLEKNGHRVVASVRNGIDAIRAIAEFTPDVAILDILLEGDLDGIDTAILLHEHWDTPVIFVTAHGDEETVKRAQAAQPSTFLVKPFKDQDLLAAVTTATYRNEHRSKVNRIPSGQFNRPPSLTSDKSHLLGNELRKIGFFTSVPIFKGLAHEDIELLARGSEVVTYAAGITLPSYVDGERPFIVANGRLGLTACLSKDRQIILAIIPPLDSLGLFNAVAEKDRETRIRVLRHSTLVMLPKTQFITVLDHDRNFSRRLSQDIIFRLNEAYRRIRFFLSEDTEERIYTLLRSLLSLFPSATASNGNLILDVTRKEIAELAGVSLEAAVQALKNLEKEQLISLSNRRFIEICNPQRLLKETVTEVVI
jgi:CheY-like chemotaxis protein/CRP-like cAMP-binding protein